MPDIIASFDKYNYLQCPIRSLQSNVILYTTHTTSGVLRRKVTTLTADGDVTIGAIFWRDQCLQVNGETRSFDAIKQNNSPWYSGTSWAGQEFKIKLKLSLNQSHWQATTETSQVVATFTLYQHHFFREDEPAILYISDDVSEQDQIMLILVFLYSEMKRRDREKTSFK